MLGMCKKTGLLWQTLSTPSLAVAHSLFLFSKVGNGDLKTVLLFFCNYTTGYD